MSRLQVRPEAEREAFEAALWYENERRGLGEEFLAALRAAFKRIESSPRQFPSVSQSLRRALLRRFPYGVARRSTPGEDLRPLTNCREAL
jgi:hypothetical protein